VSWGPGLRWALMGPSLQYHVSGGAGGIHHFLQGVFEGLLPVFKTLGDPAITPELKSRIAEGVLSEAGSRTIDQLTNAENEQLVALLKLRAERA
jgi:hypothetical protein